MDWRRRWFPNGEWVLVLALLVETAVFALVAPNFATPGNAVEISRLSVELGLLAVAVTPIIVTGGIDLSVGSMMGLSAVVFGALWQAGGLPVPAAVALALLLGLAGGALNAALIARIGVPPLIVTLGTLSLFRGLAEAITQGAVSYSGFPPAFLALGQGYLGGVLPAQVPVLALACAGYAVLLHRSTLGRALYAIGFSAAGARYAGIPVPRRVGLVYILSGLAASVAGVISAAHLGDHGRGAGGRVGLRRPGHHLGHAAGALRTVGAAERPAACRAALGADRRVDGIAPGDHHRGRLPPGAAAPARGGAGGGGDTREERSGRGAVCRRAARLAHRRRHQRLADPLGGAGARRARGPGGRPGGCAAAHDRDDAEGQG